MVHVENCALAHVLAALRAEAVRGRVLHVCDFATNIVTLYRAVEGKRPAPVVLPYWVLLLAVRVCCCCHVLLATLSCGRVSLLAPMSGLHDGAMQVRATAARLANDCVHPA